MLSAVGGAVDDVGHGPSAAALGGERPRRHIKCSPTAGAEKSVPSAICTYKIKRQLVNGNKFRPGRHAA